MHPYIAEKTEHDTLKVHLTRILRRVIEVSADKLKAMLERDFWCMLFLCYLCGIKSISL